MLHRLHNTLTNAPAVAHAAYMIADPLGALLEWSADVTTLIGDTTELRYNQLLGDVLLPLAGQDAKITAIADGIEPPWFMEQVGVGQTDRYISICVMSHPRGVILIISDATFMSQQQLRLQQQHHELLLLNERLHTQQQRLLELNADLETLSQRKSHMLAVVTHDLRSPLSAISGFVDLIERDVYGVVPADLHEPIQSIDRLARQMLSMTATLLDVRRLELDELLVRTPIAVVPLVRQAVTAFADQARLANIQLMSQCSDAALTIVGDRDALQQVVTNLISNAIKFTPAGGSVTVRTHSIVPPKLTPPLDTQRAWLAIEVQDTGYGIASGELSRIFDPFYRTRAAQSRGVTGSGLGLMIVQTAVRQHGGRVTVSSAAGLGSTFTVYLPCVDDAPSAV